MREPPLRRALWLSLAGLFVGAAVYATTTLPHSFSANETLCLQIMKSSGQQANGTVPAFQTALCNVLFAMKAGAAGTVVPGSAAGHGQPLLIARS